MSRGLCGYRLRVRWVLVLRLAMQIPGTKGLEMTRFEVFMSISLADVPLADLLQLRHSRDT